ncbi:MAG: CRISPR-associated endonuclease Cas1 [Bacteroidia bacterium]
MHLVINSYGCSLSKSKGRFCIRSESGETFVSPEKVTAITLSNACSLTTDAVMLALEHDIPIVLLTRTGKPVGRFWSQYFGSIPTIRRNQLIWSSAPEGADWVVHQLIQKAQLQIVHLQKLADLRPKNSRELKACCQYIESQIEKLSELSGKPIAEIAATLRGVEGSVSRVYFTRISDCLPPRYQFEGRSRRPAMDRFNATLNYFYGMLYNLVETAIIAAGLDPALPVLHRDAYHKPSFAYDFIEPFRPWADEIASSLCLQKKLKSLHFQPKDAGEWLSDNGRALAVEVFDVFMDEKPGKSRGELPPRKQIFSDASSLAQSLLKYSTLPPEPVAA